jgi:glutathione S-transferase
MLPCPLQHSLALVYPVWFAQPGDEDFVERIQNLGSANVINDMNEVEQALQDTGGPYLCGKTFTAA